MAKKARSKKSTENPPIDLNAAPEEGLPKGKLVAVKAALKQQLKESADTNPLFPKFPKLPGMVRAMKQFMQDFGGPAKMMKAHTMAAAAEVAPAKAGLSNICGVFIGRKYTEQGVVPGLCIRFHVVKKVANASEIDSAAQIPPFIKYGNETYPTDVIETGPIVALQGVGTPQRPANGRQKDAPIPAGSSISSEVTGETGTIGALCVVDETIDGNYILCILSNNHVAASTNQGIAYVDNHQKPSKIFHAGAADSQTRKPIAVLYRYSPLKFTGTNEVDAALSFAKSDLVSAKHESFTIDPKPLEVYPNMMVKKEGRTTFYTEGVVDGIIGQISAAYHVNGQQRTAYFENQIAIYGAAGQPFSKAGDSGSLICELNSSRPVGLLYSGNDQRDPRTGRYDSYANPISAVMSALNISKFLPDPDIFVQ